MAANYEELILDIHNFDASKMKYIKPLEFFKIEKSMAIYYKTDTKNTKTSDKKNLSPFNNGKKKIIIQTPKMILPFKVMMGNYNILPETSVIFNKKANTNF